MVIDTATWQAILGVVLSIAIAVVTKESTPTWVKTLLAVVGSAVVAVGTLALENKLNFSNIGEAFATVVLASQAFYLLFKNNFLALLTKKVGVTEPEPFRLTE